ncbi:hypothetical protein ACE3MQ_17325 [Paenibacillus lentus]|uniref:hypothetical protein n=1 Tax=Paenibacillus lentus TaxID=1338368 RepID=UPI00365EE9C4
MRSPIASVIRNLRSRRKRRRTPLLKSILLLSALLLFLPSRIGNTYGEFASSSDAAVTLQACQVFPGEIESLLSQINVHIKNASAIKNDLHSFTARTTLLAEATAFIPPSASASATDAVYNNTVTDATYHESPIDPFSRLSQGELQNLAKHTSLQIDMLQDTLTAIHEQLNATASSFQNISNELHSGASSLNHAIQLIKDMPINCVKFSQSTLLDETENLLDQDSLLSPSFYASLADLSRYLRQVYDAGIAVQNVPNSLTNQLSSQEWNYRTPNEATFDVVGQQFLQYYDDLWGSLEAHKQTITSEILQLESRLLDMSTAAGEKETPRPSPEAPSQIEPEDLEEIPASESRIQDE